jgi:hypothetical protein
MKKAVFEREVEEHGEEGGSGSLFSKEEGGLGEGGLGQLVRDVRKGREGWARQAREVEKVGLGKLGVGVSLVPSC